MPIYEYRCVNDHTFEVFQSMSEEPADACVECGASAERVMRAPAVHFKGSGFYSTDYARKGAKQPADDGGQSGGDSAGSSKDKGKSGGGGGDASASKSADD